MGNSESRIDSIEKLTDLKFVNLYLLRGEARSGKKINYNLASRAKDTASLKLSSGKNIPDGVAMYALYGEKKDKVVLIKQYRFTIGGFIYEFPAGLTEEGETLSEAAVREMHEETGLSFEALETDPMYGEARFTTVGLTDESVSLVFGYASGEPDNRYQEGSEDIEVVLADRKECEKILKEERVAVQCAYQLMHFIHDEDPFAFLRLKGI